MKNGSFTGEMSRKHNMKFWLTSERAGQIILITKGNDMKKGMRIAAAVMAAAFSMTVLAGCGKSETKTAETTAAAAASAENSSVAETAAASDEKKDLREVNVVLDWYPNAM